MIIFFAHSAGAAPSCLDLLSSHSENIEPVEKVFTSIQVFSMGTKVADQILFLSERNYRQLLQKRTLLEGTILVLDFLPSDVDLPLVAAVFLRRPLSSQDTHNQILAQKNQIPIAHLQSTTAIDELGRLRKSGLYFKVECSNSNCKILSSEKRFPRPFARPSVLPKQRDRDVGLVFRTTFKGSIHDEFSADDLRGGFEILPREIYGDKFHSLNHFSFSFPDLIPLTVSVSSGAYERFIRTHEVNGKSLFQFIQEMTLKIAGQSSAGDEAGVQKSHAEIQNAFKSVKLSLRASGFAFFKEVSTELHAIYKGKLKGNELFSVRSNNDVEDLFASGLYHSGVARSLAPEDIAGPLIDTWMSLFDYRAYTFRRANRQQEKNLSMPVLWHPFVLQKAHSLLKVEVNAEGKYIFTAQVAFGERVNSTNPTQATKTFQFEVDFAQGKKPQIRRLSSEVGERAEHDAFLKGFIPFIERIMPFAESELKQRAFAKKSIDFEIVWVDPGQVNPSATEIIVLQYKPVFDRPIIDALLAGELVHKQLEAYAYTGRSLKGLQESGYFSFLGQLKPEQVFGGVMNKYAIIQINGKNRLVVWDKRDHVHMKGYLEGVGAIWLKSGTMEYTKEKSGAFLLHFRKTTIFSNDSDRSEDILKEIFLEALSDLEKSSPEWQRFIQSPNIKISFDPTYEPHYGFKNSEERSVFLK